MNTNKYYFPSSHDTIINYLLIEQTLHVVNLVLLVLRPDFNFNNQTGVWNRFDSRRRMASATGPTGRTGATGAAGPAGSSGQAGTPGLKSPVRVRKFFPETWIWADPMME